MLFYLRLSVRTAGMAVTAALLSGMLTAHASARASGRRLPKKDLSSLHSNFRNSCTTPNASYFASPSGIDGRLRTPDGIEELWSGLAGDQVAQSSVSRWGALLREREQRSQQGLWSRDQDYLLHSRISAEGPAALVSDFKSAQQRRRSVQLREAADRVRKQNPDAAVPLQVIAVAATVTTGQPVSARVGDSARIVARTDLTSRQAQLRVETPWVESDFRMNGREALNAQEERYRLELSRGIPGVPAQGSVGYGGSSSLVTTAVKTRLSPSWLCVVDSSRPLDPARSGVVGDDRIRFEYGIRF